MSLDSIVSGGGSDQLGTLSYSLLLVDPPSKIRRCVKLIPVIR